MISYNYVTTFFPIGQSIYDCPLRSYWWNFIFLSCNTGCFIYNCDKKYCQIMLACLLLFQHFRYFGLQRSDNIKSMISYLYKYMFQYIGNKSNMSNNYFIGFFTIDHFIFIFHKKFITNNQCWLYISTGLFYLQLWKILRNLCYHVCFY